jgi:hypothetical protein
MSPAKLLIIFGCCELATKKEDGSMLVWGKVFMKRIFSFVRF